jgi:hypothetical protein
MSTESDFSAMTLDELWLVHEYVSKLLVARLTAQHRQLDVKLAIVQRRLSGSSASADDAKSTKVSRRQSRADKLMASVETES